LSRLDPTVRGASDHEPSALEKTTRLLARRKWIVLQAVVLLPAVVLALSLSERKSYTATASLLFRNSETPTTLSDPARDAATNQELVSLPTVAQRTSRALRGALTESQVSKSVEIHASELSDVVKISATAAKPRLAARLANAYGQEYIAFRQLADRQRIQDGITVVQRSLAVLPPEQVNGTQGKQLRDRLEQLTVSQALQTGNAELVQRAGIPQQPSSPKTQRNVILGLIGGLLIGFGLAAALERIDQRVKTLEELERMFDLPVLARVPRSRSLAADLERLPQRPLEGSAAEAFRTLRVNLRYFAVERELQTILVASPLAGDGKSTVSWYLAVAMASMGDKVVVVEADLHKPSLVPASEEAVDVGLSAVLVDYASLDDALFEVPLQAPFARGGARALSIIPSGGLPPNPAELLESKRMRTVLSELKSRFDFVVIDTPPLSVVSDALSLVPEASGVLVVTAVGRATRRSIIDFNQQMLLLRTKPLGIVVNYFPALEPSDYGYYGYGRGYDPGVTADEAISPTQAASRGRAGSTRKGGASDRETGAERSPS
jgi:capsular exopolysaccharide synthesis family protein